jgi:hypothetical protein
MTDKINIIIPLEGGRKWQKEFNPEDKIEKVAEIFKKENNMEFPEQYIMNLKFQNRQINMNDPVKTLVSNNKQNLIFDINLEQNGLNLKNNKMINFELLGKPISDPFQIHVYDKKEKKIRLIYLDKEEIKNSQIGNYNNESAYCNGNNHLYISGGENKNLILNDFWDIDLKNEKITKICDLIEPKKNHSMICIGGKYIFIVGGNTKKTFYYDIEKKEIYNYENLNINRTEPALIQIGNELYCFDNLKKGNNEITFEKTNLKENKKWELIQPEIKENFSQKFFGTSILDNDNILFLGGYMLKDSNNKNLMNFKYNIKENIISESDIPFKEMNLSEKNSYKIDEKKDIIIPEYKKEEPEIMIFDKTKKSIKKISFETDDTKSQKKTLSSTFRSGKPLKTYNYNMPLFTDNDIEKLSKDLKGEYSEKINEKYQGRNKKYKKKNSEDEIETTSKTKAKIKVNNKIKKRSNNFADDIISTSKKKNRHSNSKSSFGGALIRNSVIINNIEGSVLNPTIPKIQKGNRIIKSEIVEVNENFDKNEIKGLTQNINIGIGGKKEFRGFL